MRRLSICALTLAACGPQTLLIGETEEPPEDWTPGGADTAGALDTADPATDDTGAVESVGAATAPSVNFSPNGGGFSGSVEVTLSGDDEGTAIYYTLDGSIPSVDSATLYAGPITLDASTTLRAVAENVVGVSEPESRSYVALAPEIAAFTSDVPVLVLHSFEDIPTSKTGEYTPITVNAFSPSADGRTRVEGEAELSLRAGLKVRGSSSAGYPKLGYSLELWGGGENDDYDAELLGMPAESDWVLYAPLYFDRALMRNALIYELSNAVGRYAARTRFVEVYATGDGDEVRDDDYLGVYILTERLKQGPDRIDVTDIESDDIGEPGVTGGYVLKRDRLGIGESGFDAGSAGGRFDFEQTLAWVYPKEESLVPEQSDWVEADLDRIGWALASPSMTDAETGEHYSELLDVEAWIDHHALNVLTKNPDALRLSGYFHKDREGRWIAGPIWDFDRTMGCEGDSRAEDPTWWDASNITTDTTYFFDYGWYAALFEDPDFSDAYWARFEELLANELSVENMHAVVDRMAEELEEAAPRNFERWSSYGPRGGSHASEVEILKGWLERRHAWISACIEAYDDPRVCRGE